MNKDAFDEKIFWILFNNGLLDLWLNNTREGLILCDDKGSLLFQNSKSNVLLNRRQEKFPSNLKVLFSKEELSLLTQNRSVVIDKESKALLIRVFLKNKYMLILLDDYSKEKSLTERIEKVTELNKELQSTFEQYADDTIYIADNQGITLRAGEDIAYNCGVTNDYLRGKNVADLEREGVFYPSVTLKVLESKEPEVVIQKTKGGKTLIAVGTPLFDNNNQLTKIISITRDISKQVKIGTLLSKIGDINTNTDQNSFLYSNFVTCSDKLFNIIELVKLVAAVNSTVLINGETGTGKDVIARLIQNFSARSKKPFIKINCGAIAPNLVESELFGYEPGSFTGANKAGKVGLIEAANGGTLFLDEISELPLEQQVKLLQVLQERKLTRVGGTKTTDIDVRFIAATNKNLEELVEKKQFREDLFYRLNVVPIYIPPLRERREDIPLLTKHFTKIFNTNYHQNKDFSKETLSYLYDYDWPGNVRELEHMVERLIVITKKPLIEVNDLPEKIIKFKSENKIQKNICIQEIMPLQSAVEETEKELIQMALQKYGTASKAAEILEVNQSTISRKIQRYGTTSKFNKE